MLEKGFVMSICLSQEAWSIGLGRHSELWSALLLCHSISTFLWALPWLLPPTALLLSPRVTKSGKNKIWRISFQCIWLKKISYMISDFFPFSHKIMFHSRNTQLQGVIHKYIILKKTYFFNIIVNIVWKFHSCPFLSGDKLTNLRKRLVWP